MFSEKFYLTTLGLMIEDNAFQPNIWRLSNDFFYDNDYVLGVFGKIRNIFKKYGVVNVDIVEEEIPEDWERIKIGQSKNLEGYVKKNVRKHIFLSSVSQGAKKLAREMEKGYKDVDEETIKKTLEETLAAYISESDGGMIWYFQNPARRMIDVGIYNGIPTGIYGLDEILFGGGLCPGELGIILGRPNAGKSGVLINLAVSALAHMKKVLYITLEISDKKTAHRFDMRLTGFSSNDLSENFGTASKQLKDFKNITGSDLVIKEFPTGKASVLDIVNCVKELQRVDNFYPDILFVDYADIVRPHAYKNEKRLALGAIYESLRGLGSEFKIPVWTASQGNRPHKEDVGILDMNRIAEDYSKTFTADVIVSINYPEDDANVMYLFLAKNRSYIGRRKIKCYNDWTRMLVTDYSDYEFIRNM